MSVLLLLLPLLWLSWHLVLAVPKRYLAGGDYSNLAGGDYSLIVGRNGCKAKGGMNSVIVLTAWEWIGDEYKPTAVKAEIVDGEKIKPDTWYTLKGGEFVEVTDDET